MQKNVLWTSINKVKMSINRMKFFTLKTFFDFLPITLFLLCVRIFDSRVTRDWKYPMLMGGTIALVLFIYYLYFRFKQNRIAFGMSLLFHNDRIFSELIPFTFLFIIYGFLKHHNSKEKKKSNMDLAK